MSTAQVVNSGIIGPTARVTHSRSSVATSVPFIDPLSGAFAPPARDQAQEFDGEFDGGGRYGRRRRYVPYQDHVVSFGGVLVSREVGATIMQAQAAAAARNLSPLTAEAERGIAIYEFNQALMGAAEAMTDVGLSH